MKDGNSTLSPDKIERLLRKDCSGCGCCAQKCPAGCIAMKPNAEGFLYPRVEKAKCRLCRACVVGCPCLQKRSAAKPISAFALMSTNEKVRRQSSSGGICALLSRAAVRRGGVAFGAAFDDKLKLRHTAVDSLAAISTLQGSKYVQSDVGDTFIQARSLLREGRRVLYTGLPCQIAGLKSFLGGATFPGELLCVDLICHGVPSPRVLAKYIKEQERLYGAPIANISFRDKSESWKHYFTRMDINSKPARSEILRKNIYVRGFHSNLYLRECCHQCKFKGYRSGSDLLTGDFWNVREFTPDLDDDKGINIVIALTQRGLRGLLELHENIDGRIVHKGKIPWNYVINTSAVAHPNRAEFFRELPSASSVSALIERMLRK